MTTKINPNLLEDYFANLLEDYFVFLDELKESGKTNMYGAAAYLIDEFDLDKKMAQEILALWMETFSKRHPRGR